MATSLSSRSSVASVHPTRQQLDELDALLQRMLDLPVSGPEEEQPAAPTRSARAKKTVDKTVEAPVEPPAPKAENLPPMPAALPEDYDSIGPRVVGGVAPVEEGANEADGEDSEAWVPLRSSWQPSPQTWGPLAKQWQAQQSRQSTRKKKKGPRPESARPEPPRDEEPDSDEASEPEPDESIAEANAPPRPLPTSWQVDARPAVLAPAAPPNPPTRPAEAPAAPVETAADQPPVPVLLWPFVALDVMFDRFLALGGPLGRPWRSPGGKALLALVGVLGLLGAAAVAALDLFGWTW